VPDSGNPQAFNRYMYTLGNPLKYTDPSGHCVVTVALLVGGTALLADWLVQYSQNRQAGLSFWEATAHENLDKGELATAGAIGTVGGLMLAASAPLVAAGGTGAVVGQMGLQAGSGMLGSGGGYLASSYVSGRPTTAEELYGVSAVPRVESMVFSQELAHLC